MTEAVHDRPTPSNRARSTRRRLATALALAVAYMIAEVVGGFLTGSLALLADAGHMLSDAAALVLALFASWVAGRPADSRWTYGHARAEILAALAQGLALVGVALIIATEALDRLGDPREVLGAGMFAIASGGLAVNLVALFILNAGREESLNVRGAWLHVLGDALGSVGAMIAGALIWAFAWTWVDPVASLAICALVLVSAWHLIREAVDVLMEAAPRGLDIEEITRSLCALDGVRSVHDLHVWSVGYKQIALSCHLVVPRDGGCTPLLSTVYALLGQRYRIDHATIQIEPEDFAEQTPRTVCGCAS
ncbi:MAG: cation diffusion facilitator family transporter [Myxococcales bacterium]|nr:cation diffusion facilitator family transporter [Myxococcales bacterium]MDH5306060.1 cation diffusion facilitator family transporter [Myxococcales bacterium]MDH5565995.1 cation diffusion facilitator family transporter [Myxococcales bacterium]